MIEKNTEMKNKFKKNIKFIILVIILSLIAWFGVKLLVSKSGAAATSTTKKGSSLIQSNSGFGGGVARPANDGGAGFRAGGGN